MHTAYSDVVNTACEYYNSDDADRFYTTIWGGEDIHIGIYASETESIFAASRGTVERQRSTPSLIENRLQWLKMAIRLLYRTEWFHC